MTAICVKMKKKTSCLVLFLVILAALLLQPGCSHDLYMRKGVGNEGLLPPDGCVNESYFYDLNTYFCAWNTTKSITFKNSGTLPPGLKLDQTLGIISGTATSSGAWKFSIRVEDSSGTVLDQDEFIIKINTFKIVTSPSLPPACMLNSYNAVIHICGGTPPYKWQILNWSPETQPLKFLLNQTTERYNNLTGTPDKCYQCSEFKPWYEYNFLVTVTDKNNNMAEKKFNLRVTSDITVLSPYKLPTGYVGKSYNYNLLACGGAPPYSWKKTGGSLPVGLNLSGDGKINGGSPTTAGNYAFKVELTDTKRLRIIPNGFFNILVVNAPLKLSNRTFTMVECVPVNVPVGGTGYVSGGYGPRYWQLKSGTLPTGITLTADGYLKGQPAEPGTFNFKVCAYDVSTDPNYPPSAAVTVKVTAKPADTAGIVVERFRQASYGSTGYKENEIDLSDSTKLKVDFLITDTAWEKTWNSLATEKKQVTLKVIGSCSYVIKASGLGYGNADGDATLEHIARFDVFQFKNLVDAAGGKEKSPFDFRILVKNLESSSELVKIFKNVKVK